MDVAEITNTNKGLKSNPTFEMLTTFPYHWKLGMKHKFSTLITSIQYFSVDSTEYCKEKEKERREGGRVRDQKVQNL